MLRSAIWLLLAFAGAVILALVLQSNHGNVAILWPPYRIELSSNMALVVVSSRVPTNTRTMNPTDQTRKIGKRTRACWARVLR